MTNAAGFIDLGDDTVVSGILQHFSLSELEPIRGTSHQFLRACNGRKSFIFSLLKRGSTVEIANLTSAKGKQVNGRLGIVAGNLDGGRFPILLRHLTGETEKLSVRPQNLNPFVTDEQMTKEENRLAFINYSSDGKVREGHGRLLDQTLMMLRFHTNIHEGCRFYDGDFMGFYQIPRGDPRMLHCNAAVYTRYKVKPSASDSADYVEPLQLSVLDETIKVLLESTQMERYGSMAGYAADGPDGKLIIHNFIRSMHSWDTERITGSFWLSKITKTGTILVRNLRGDDIEWPDSLGEVYLVKGIASTVGENTEDRFPVLADMTFLPMYHFLVYDGIMLYFDRNRPSAELKRRIEEKVEVAIRNETIIYHGASASKGLWDSDPPIYEIPVPEDIYNSEKEEFDKFKPIEAEIDLAKQIVVLAKEADCKSNRDGGTLVARRMDYTPESNPNRIFNMMYIINGNPLHMSMFTFENWPSYNLHELLGAILEIMQQYHFIPNMFWIDDKEHVQALKKVLHVASEREQFDENFNVEWYTPPSEEEDTLLGRYRGC